MTAKEASVFMFVSGSCVLLFFALTLLCHRSTSAFCSGIKLSPAWLAPFGATFWGVLVLFEDGNWFWYETVSSLAEMGPVNSHWLSCQNENHNELYWLRTNRINVPEKLSKNSKTIELFLMVFKPTLDAWWILASTWIARVSLISNIQRKDVLGVSMSMARFHILCRFCVMKHSILRHKCFPSPQATWGERCK